MGRSTAPQLPSVILGLVPRTQSSDAPSVVGRDAYIAVYIMANGKRGTLYVGVTSDLARRVYEHREGLIPGFTKDYGCKQLVWYEPHELMTEAIRREKAIKHYLRD